MLARAFSNKSISKNLRTRTQITVAILLTLFLIIAMFTSWLTLRKSFDEFERKSITQELSRLELWINEELESLRRSANDYAFWDDTYDFVEGNNPGYTEENIDPDVFDNLDIDAFVIITTQGNIYAEKQRSVNSDGETMLVPINDEFGLWLQKRSVITTVQKTIVDRGIIDHFRNVPIFIGAAPILRSDSSGPSVGTLLMIRIMDSRRIAVDNPLGSKEWEIIESTSDRPITMGLNRSNNDWTITRELAGVKNEGITYISLKSEAQLHEQFSAAIRISSINLALMVIITLILIGYILNCIILNRLLYFSEKAEEIRASGDLGIRIPHDNNDELDHLALTVNGMLDELQDTNRQLYHDSLHDTLTGLGNRALLNERLDYTLKLSRVEGEPFALLIVDLDNFKDINDLHGHAAGDAILARTAIQLIEWCGSADTAVRLGGDEFAIIRILPSNAIEELSSDVDALRAAISGSQDWEGEQLKVSASIGIAISNPETEDETASNLLRNADTALYRAKEDGRNRFCIFTPDMREMLFKRMTLMQELEDAIINDKLTLFFQPTLDHQGKPFSIEALVRWQHPERGLLAPDYFIPIAESSLLITHLDIWVIKAACASLKRLRQYFPDLSMTVNCSARTLFEKDVTATLLSEMGKYGLPESTVNVELTETALARNETEMVPILERMAANEIRIYLDDFGTGYSSLNRLHLLPFHYLKVDRSFVRRIDKGDQTITRTIIQLAKSLEKKVVVEGVETETQREILERLGADYMQGYLFSRPLPEKELIEWLAGVS
ncbi:MAG: EAL domain-containing protein [Gammaproteobacteria bacterium]|nr:EAL domain-containing protein [Gammaproteobacteria bacterium]MCW8993890.1 EAL domain-containing protein [Gammaproteobacteria bacterium]